MNAENPDRTIGGLTNRSAMSRLARPTPPPLSAPESTTPAPAPAPAPTPKAPPAPPAQPAAATARTQVSVYVDKQLRDRAQAAYKATSHLEDDRSWSGFVAAAILAETERRETAHNQGQPFQNNGIPLTPGRPLA